MFIGGLVYKRCCLKQEAHGKAIYNRLPYNLYFYALITLIMIQMFNFPFNFKKAFSLGEKKPEKKVSKKQKITPTLSVFTDAATCGVSRSTADNYRTAVRSFVRFNGGRDIPLSTFNADTVRSYERWLSERDICPNTSSCYMRSLRAIYNKAVSKRLIKDKGPFKDVFTGNEKTIKRGLEAKEIRKLLLFPFPHEEEIQLVRDLFLFSFYSMGIPFVDLAHLKQSQVENGVLTYHRHKTGRQIRVTLEPCMLDILTKYKMKDTAYLFPILYKVKKGKQVMVSYSYALNRYNRMLKNLARQAGIRKGLTSYVARHSWASIAYANNIDLPIISKALGHSDTKTTLTYIREINNKRLTQANRKLLKGLFASTTS